MTRLIITALGSGFITTLIAYLCELQLEYVFLFWLLASLSAFIAAYFTEIRAKRIRRHHTFYELEEAKNRLAERYAASPHKQHLLVVLNELQDEINGI